MVFNSAGEGIEKNAYGKRQLKTNLQLLELRWY